MKSTLALILAALVLEASCAPAVPKDLPKETFAINLHPKIAPELRASVEAELERLFAEDEDLF